LEESHAPTWEEVSERTINRLHNLGNQRFALSPFDEYFGSWLIDLREVLTEFESSPAVIVDDQFRGERSRILSSVAAELERRRSERLSRDEAVKSLADNKTLLERIEKEYHDKAKEIEQQKDAKIKRLSRDVEELSEERDRIAEMKTGIFRRLSKKEKERKEDEVAQQLDAARLELKQTAEHSSAEQARLREEYETRKKPVVDQIRDQQKEVEDQEVDWSVEARRATCEALADEVKELRRRREPSTN
jgi:hypothetical protein